MEKRAAFIGNVYSLNQEFYFATHDSDYADSTTQPFMGPTAGSLLLGSLTVAKTWNVNLRIMYDLQRETHCWIMEDVSGGKHFLQIHQVHGNGEE